MKLYIMGFVIGFRSRKISALPNYANEIVRIGLAVFLLLSLMAFIPVNAVAQNGVITGKVTDAENGDPLPLAEVVIEETGQRVTTDKDGIYIFRGMPSGNHAISVNYLGYNMAQVSVSGGSGERIEQSVELQKDFMDGDRMFVTSAQRNRARALNSQLRSVNPVYIITSDQMSRSADYTVQDAIVRMPGVQTSGRGDFSLRGTGLGMYNITVDGQRMATTGNTNRRVDLGMLSTDIYREVEYIKVLTPDMDADAIGGVINLSSHSPVGLQRMLDVSLGGGTDTHYYDLMEPDRRFSVRYTDTMTDDLTLTLNLNSQRLTKSWESIAIDYDVAEFDEVSTDVVERFSPGLHNDERNIMGGLLQLTWKSSDISSFHVRGIINSDNRRINLHRSNWIANGNWVDASGEVSGGRFWYDFGSQEIKSRQFTFQAGGRHLLNAFNIDYNLGWARSHVNDRNLLMPFVSGAINYSIDMTDRNRPEVNLIDSELPQSRQMVVDVMENTLALNVDNIYSGRIDAEIPVGPLSFKLGSSTRLMAKDVNDLGAYVSYDMTYRGFVRLNEFEMNWRGTDVFDQYDIPWLAEGSEVKRFFNVNSHTMARDRDKFRETSEFRNYKVNENIYAGYGMATFELGSLTLLGGARLEYTDSDNYGRLIQFDRFGRYYSTTDTSQTNSRSDLFPNAQVIFTPQRNTRIQLAYSKSMQRPDYIMLAPFAVAHRRDSTLFRGNSALEPIMSNNFDLYIDYNFMDMGAVSVGLFYKEMHNFFYLRESMIEIQEGDVPGLDNMFNDTDETVLSIHESVFQNSDESASIYGLELSWQQNLDFLPGFLSNMGVNANYTWSHSVFDSDVRGDDVALPYQSPHVVNTSLDYSIGRLFARVSYHWTADVMSNLSTSTALAPSISTTQQVYLDQYQYGWNDLSVSARFRISENFRLWMDAFNLLPPSDHVNYVHTKELYPTMINYRRGRGFKVGVRYDL